MNSRRNVTSIVLLFSLMNFLLVAILGLVLRWYFISPIPGFIYPNWLHAHSHLAILGWVYPILFIIIFNNFEWSSILQKQLGVLFILMEASIIGMLATFPLNGYTLLPISFSTMHMLVSFFLMNKVWKLMRHQGRTSSNVLIKLSLLFMVLSAIGPLALGPLSILGYKDSIWYDLSIYFYLHFQYNGLFILSAVGLLIYMVAKNGNVEEIKLKGMSSVFIIVAFTIFTYMLSAVEMVDIIWIYFVGGLGAVLQLIFFIILLKWLWKTKGSWLPTLTLTTRFLWAVSGIAICIKILVQILTTIPSIAKSTYPIRDLVIGYLHLILLGAVTTFLLGWAIKKQWIPEGKLTFVAALVFVSGVTATELILFYRGTIDFHPAFAKSIDYSLFAISFLFLTGILLFAISATFGKNLSRSFR